MTYTDPHESYRRCKAHYETVKTMYEQERAESGQESFPSISEWIKTIRLTYGADSPAPLPEEHPT